MVRISNKFPYEDEDEIYEECGNKFVKKNNIHKDITEGKQKKCCICGEPIVKWGNDPWGALDQNGEMIKWNDNDECCDICNDMYVIQGRIQLLQRARQVKESLKSKKIIRKY